MEWISVKDRLPRQGKKVLIAWKDYRNKRSIDTAEMWKDRNGWHFTYCDVNGSNDLDDSQVTHWKLIPEFNIKP
jgi:hypothetical protein